MAVFDPVRGRICLRVVYDGPAGAGKTTNLHRLATAFARPGDVAAPFALRERTVYFDWMELAAGAVDEYPISCQVLSVPGQSALVARRRAILARADGIVVVCDGASAPPLDRYGDLPIVLQANKRDRARRFQGTPGIPVVEAIAAEGVGVVDTFVAIIGAVARRLREDTEQGFRIPVGKAESLDELLAAIAAVPIDAPGAAELFLEEALGGA